MGAVNAFGELALDQTLQDVGAALDSKATETTLAAVKTAVDAVTAKLIAAPATEASLAAAKADLDAISARLAGTLTVHDGATATAVITTLGDPAQDSTVAAVSAALGPKATETTLAAVKTAVDAVTAKIIAAPATEATLAAAKADLDAINTKLGGALTVNTVDVSALAKDATVAKDSSLTTLHNDLASVLAKIIAAPATEASLAAAKTVLDAINTKLGGALTVNTVDVSALAKDATVAKDSSLATIITALAAVLNVRPGSDTQYYRDDMDTAVTGYDGTLWNAPVVSGAGASNAVGSGVITFAVSTGGTGTDQVSITSKFSLKAPFKVQFHISLSQRIVNQAFELQIVNAGGDTLASWLFDGTTATSAKASSKKKTLQPLADATVTALSSSAANAMYEIDVQPNGTLWSAQASDSATAAIGEAQWRQRGAPVPGEAYFVKIIARNTGVPASGTTMTIDLVQAFEYAMQRVEVSGGVGANQISRAIPVFVSSGAVSLNANNNRIGSTYASGQWVDLNSTALLASTSTSGASHDLTATATGVTFNAGGAFPQEYRVSALADVVGTLYIEVSRDNATWRRIKSVTLAAAAGSGTVFYGEIIHRPSVRYVRAVFTNGGTAQAFFLLQEFLVGT